jgi:hypothetical protein
MDAMTTATVSHEIKRKATEDMFGPATAIAETAVASHVGTKPCPNLAKASNLARNVNRQRQRMRPRDPADLNFTLDMSFVPSEFLQADVVKDERLHLVFASTHMLQLLTKAKTWYADGTFYVVPQPFVQLYSLHVFVRSGSCIKQVPALFCLMSGRRTRDYKAVLKTVKALLTDECAVQRVVLDFERGSWKAVKKVFPDVDVRGCSFHWSQCIYRKIGDLHYQVCILLS